MDLLKKHWPFPVKTMNDKLSSEAELMMPWMGPYDSKWGWCRRKYEMHRNMSVVNVVGIRLTTLSTKLFGFKFFAVRLIGAKPTSWNILIRNLKRATISIFRLNEIFLCQSFMKTVAEWLNYIYSTSHLHCRYIICNYRNNRFINGRILLICTFIALYTWYCSMMNKYSV